MVRRLTPSQARAAALKAQSAYKKAIRDENARRRKHNTAAKKHNDAVKKAESEYKRDVRAYNAKVRTHNTKVENDRRRLNQELRRLGARPTTTTAASYRTSVQRLASHYETVEARLTESAEPYTFERELLDRASVEAANSAYVINALDGDGDPTIDPTEDELRFPSMAAELTDFSADLVDRWTGALFALSLDNPDAARHFCTSAREVMVRMLDIAAPTSSVAESNPDFDRTDKGVPTRRAQVSYLLSQRGVHEPAWKEFVTEDIDNALSLFQTLNSATHGMAGKFTITELAAIRMRVETAIGFLHRICID